MKPGDVRVSSAEGRSALAPLEALVPRVTAAVRRSPARRVLVAARHRDLAPADAVLASFPRSGNTWLKGMLAELLAGHEVDYAASERLIPTVGSHRQAPRLLPGGGRLLKSHELCRPEYRRAVYVVRDVREVAFSYHAFNQARAAHPLDLAGFIEELARGRIDGYGSWQSHVRSWLSARDRDAGVLVVRYEDLLAHRALELERIADHLGLVHSPHELNRVIANHGVERTRERERPRAIDAAVLGRRFAGREPRATSDGESARVARALRELAAASPLLSSLGYDVDGRSLAALPEEHVGLDYAPGGVVLRRRQSG